jgi:Holliday junction resolvase
MGNAFERFLSNYLGAEIQRGSGSGLIDREDLILGDDFLCQLKATSKASMQVKSSALKKLVQNAERAGRSPLFIIGFEENGVFTPSRVFVAVPLGDWIEER